LEPGCNALQKSETQNPFIKMNYSQNHEQDIILQYFKDQPGFFCSIGENDGETLSNVRALALAGWSGVCIEPSPKAFKRLEKLYEDNDNVMCYNAAIATKLGPVTLYESGSHLGNGDVGIVSSLIEPETLKWSDSTTFDPVEVLGTTWKAFNVHAQIDFISIDAEGMDLSILLQMDLGALGCQMLCIEYGSDWAVRNRIEKYVEPFGLKRVFVSPENLIFAL
jgi:FkbM family methyltransferase